MSKIKGKPALIEFLNLRICILDESSILGFYPINRNLISFDQIQEEEIAFLRHILVIKPLLEDLISGFPQEYPFVALSSHIVELLEVTEVYSKDTLDLLGRINAITKNLGSFPTPTSKDSLITSLTSISLNRISNIVGKSRSMVWNTIRDMKEYAIEQIPDYDTAMKGRKIFKITPKSERTKQIKYLKSEEGEVLKKQISAELRNKKPNNHIYEEDIEEIDNEVLKTMGDIAVYSIYTDEALKTTGSYTDSKGNTYTGNNIII